LVPWMSSSSLGGCYGTSEKTRICLLTSGVVFVYMYFPSHCQIIGNYASCPEHGNCSHTGISGSPFSPQAASPCLQAPLYFRKLRIDQSTPFCPVLLSNPHVVLILVNEHRRHSPTLRPSPLYNRPKTTPVVKDYEASWDFVSRETLTTTMELYTASTPVLGP